jgi:hypothetical protein
MATCNEGLSTKLVYPKMAQSRRSYPLLQLLPSTLLTLSGGIRRGYVLSWSSLSAFKMVLPQLHATDRLANGPAGISEKSLGTGPHYSL